jgi:hypothetical protein
MRCALATGSWAENSAATASIADVGNRSAYKKPAFYWAFRDGTAFADQSAWE